MSAGCSTHANRIRVARERFYAGDLHQAGEVFEAQIEQYPKDADVLNLDLAMVRLLSGDPDQAERTLREVRDRFDEFEQPDAVESTISMLTDDQRLAYDGEDYEKVLVRVFLALTNLLDDGEDAEAYSLQINAKQQELMQHAAAEQVEGAELAYTPLAIGPFVRGVLREATHSNYDDAARAYHQVVSWQPGFQHGRLDLQRAEQGSHSRPGHGVLYVFALVDRGPVKVESLEIPTTQALLIADRILSAVAEYDLPPTIAPIKVPKIFVPPREVDSALVVADGRPVGQTEIICDIAALALKQQKIQLPRIIARAVVRRIVKKTSVYVAKDYLEVASPWTNLALTATGVLWEATEAADTRCWGVLPREIQVLRVELPIGTHEIDLQPLLGGRAIAAGQRTVVEIVDGRNTYMLAYLVGLETIGHVLWKTP